MGKAMLTIMAAFAQLERDSMIERTRAGLAAAAANGRKGGRLRKVDDAAAAKARSMREKGINATDIARCLGCIAQRCTAIFPWTWTEGLAEGVSTYVACRSALQIPRALMSRVMLLSRFAVPPDDHAVYFSTKLSIWFSTSALDAEGEMAAMSD